MGDRVNLSAEKASVEECFAWAQEMAAKFELAISGLSIADTTPKFPADPSEPTTPTFNCTVTLL